MVRQTQNVIRRCIIQFGKTDQDICGNVPHAPFIAAVLRLFHVEKVRDILLAHIVIFPQIF